jgi:hypothetical protein
MPTQEQMKAVVREIDALLGGLGVVRIEEKRGVPATEGRRFLFWDEVVEEHRADALAIEINWEGFTDSEKAGVIGRVMACEPPEMWMEGMDRVNPHHQEANLGRTSAERGKESGAWPDDIEWTSPPPPSRACVEEQMRRLKASTEFTTIIERFDGPHENHFVEIRQEEKLIGRSWGELTEGQKLGQLQVATDVMLLNPQETRELLAREVDFTRVTLAEQEAYLGRPFDGPGQPASGKRDPVHQAMDIRLEPGHGNLLTWRDDHSFDIHDATGKIGYLTGYLGGPWSDADKDSEFRVTHVEITTPGRTLSPGQWKVVLHGLRRHLPIDAELIGGNRGGEGGDLSAAYEKLVRLPPARWPSEIAKANRENQKAQHQGTSNSHGHDDGHSM